jgi:stalled ribosome rescue protein Dom34
MSAGLRRAATDLFFAVLDRNRDEWLRLVNEMNEELQALHSLIEKQQTVVAALPRKWTKEDLHAGRDQDAHRESARLGLWSETEKEYRKYLPTLTNFSRCEG